MCVSVCVHVRVHVHVRLHVYVYVCALVCVCSTCMSLVCQVFYVNAIHTFHNFSSLLCACTQF